MRLDYLKKQKTYRKTFAVICWAILTLQILQTGLNSYFQPVNSEEVAGANSTRSVGILIQSEEKIQRRQKVEKNYSAMKQQENLRIVEEPVVTLEKLLSNPKTKVVDIIPYLPEELYEENLKWMAIGIDKEARGCDDEVQQAQGMVMVSRAFWQDGKSFSDGTGNIRTVLFWTGYNQPQYPWAVQGYYNEEPSERALENAAAVLSGNVIDSEMTIDVVYANTTRLGHGVYKEFLAPNGKTVYFCYV